MKSRFTVNRDGKGTKEWSDISYNICRGCEHGCLYCFAKSQACRFKSGARFRIPGEWQKQKLNPNRTGLGREVKPLGVVMFPTSHDITPSFLPQSLATIKNLLLKNEVLIVSKPHLSVVKSLCKELADSKAKILFRFSIGSLKPEQCAFWEPGAPSPLERIAALRHAFERGFQTSVSIEPMLDDRAGICELVAAVEPFASESIWIGKMQRIPMKQNAHVPTFADEVEKIRLRQTDGEILQLVADMKGRGKIRWKDSIKAVLKEADGVGA
jgi:hypothetical protein